MTANTSNTTDGELDDGTRTFMYDRMTDIVAEIEGDA